MLTSDRAPPSLAPRPSLTLRSLLEARARETPGKVAYSFLESDDRAPLTITYQELHLRARELAAILDLQGLAGGRALLLFPPGLDFIVAYFGCLEAGVVAVPVPLPTRHTPPELVAGIWRSCRPSAILALSRSADAIERATAALPESAGASRILLDRLPVGGGVPVPGTDDPARLAMIQYTSGSTSAPRGVELTHENLLANSALIQRSFGTSRNTVGVFWLPHFHDMGLIGGILQPLYCGGSAILMSPTSFLQRPALWLQAISRFRGTISGGPDFAYDLCVRRISALERERLDLRSWEVAFDGSEKIRPCTLERFAETFRSTGFRRSSLFPCYGLAEATLLVTGGPRGAGPIVKSFDSAALARDQVVIVEPEDPRGRPIAGCGEVLPGQRVVIADPDSGSPRKDQEIGEIWVRGPSISRGYHARDSQDVFGAQLSGAAGETFLRTGDLGFLHAGQLFVVGRLKDRIIIRGRNHHPEDIEHAMDGLRDDLRAGHAAAFSVEGPRGERLVIVQEVEPHHLDIDSTAAIRTIRETISTRFQVEVSAVILVRPRQVPKTSSGKTRRSACRDRYLAGQLETIAAWELPPAEPVAVDPLRSRSGATVREIEDWLTRRIGARLDLPSTAISVTRSFHELGLGSLDAVEIVADLETWLGRPVSPIVVYDHPTIAAVARWLAVPGPRPGLAVRPALRSRPPPRANPERLIEEVRRMDDGEILTLLEQDIDEERES